MTNKYQNMDLRSEAFKGFMDDMNEMLTKTVSGMQRKDTNKGTITAKIEIGIIDRELSGNAIYPQFTYDITTAIQYKDKSTGKVAGTYELIWDEAAEAYIMRSIGQPTLFDQAEEEYNVDDRGVVLGLPATGLPEGTDVIDADFEILSDENIAVLDDITDDIGGDDDE